MVKNKNQQACAEDKVYIAMQIKGDRQISFFVFTGSDEVYITEVLIRNPDTLLCCRHCALRMPDIGQDRLPTVVALCLTHNLLVLPLAVLCCLCGAPLI